MFISQLVCFILKLIILTTVDWVGVVFQAILLFIGTPANWVVSMMTVDKPKNRSVANIVVLLFEALYILQLTDTVTAELQHMKAYDLFPLACRKTLIIQATQKRCPCFTAKPLEQNNIGQQLIVS